MRSNPKNTALIERNLAVVEMVREGRTYLQVSETTGLSTSRICAIVREYCGIMSDDDTRDNLRLQLEYGLAKLMAILRQERQPKVTPSGKLVYETGEDGKPDYSRPVYDDSIIIETMKAVVSVQDRLSKSYALDKPRQKIVDETPELNEAMGYVSTLNEQRKEAERRAVEMEKRTAELEQRLALYEGMIEAEVVI